jgi:hypothetical protein
MDLISAYFSTLAQRFGEGWNRFWFTRALPDTLSLMRPLVGLIALAWHATYTADLVAFFGPGGVITPDLWNAWTSGSAIGGGVSRFNYLIYANSAQSLVLMHWIGFAVLLAFTLGLLTRAATIGALIVAISYIHRAPMLTSEFEPVLTMVLAYFTFAEIIALFERPPQTPFEMLSGDTLGARFSIDSWLRGASQPLPSAAANIGTRLLQLHVSAVYFMSAIAKLGVDAWWSGEAVWWLVAKPEGSSYFLAPYLDDHVYLLNFLTHSIVWFQLAFALLIWNRMARPLLVALSLPLWCMVALVSGFWLFSAIMFAAGLAFVAPQCSAALGRSRAVLLASSQPMPAPSR